MDKCAGRILQPVIAICCSMTLFLWMASTSVNICLRDHSKSMYAQYSSILDPPPSMLLYISKVLPSPERTYF